MELSQQHVCGLVPIAVRISALCGQARQLELKSDQETSTHQGTRKRKADSDRRQHAFLGALAVWLQSPYCLPCRWGTVRILNLDREGQYSEANLNEAPRFAGSGLEVNAV